MSDINQLWSIVATLFTLALITATAFEIGYTLGRDDKAKTK
ncbi:unnamed protein product [Fructobacillus evanidus]|uniref:Uncharacterized protein n=1 Tax=Fructobacillus evanidus TaxID=3064281 RepID=A0ABN9YZA2_9LACO|nr:MAG: hypothetical protein [Caudoviricetes sp.]CAK1224581.1 unnamed protein product [Fructobacillus sp. LMG 32999]CAK1254695.1 unnamed protein product [Fructobacillus tropaeoli]CAK1243577.1 unnamed protein product [Fructobacillus sp. LMG 32999]CAK1254160.1 unnamed protein product [Fructobacillus sp. LMG 32999]